MLHLTQGGGEWMGGGGGGAANVHKFIDSKGLSLVLST